MSTLELDRSDDRITIRIDGVRLFEHSATRPAVRVGLGAPVVREAHGNYRIKPRIQWTRPLHRADIVSESAHGIELVISNESAAIHVSAVGDATANGLAHLSITPKSGEFNRLRVCLPADGAEPTFGGGIQFSRFNLRGSRLPIWTGEQGVGRGPNLTTLRANLHNGSGGHWHSTYFPQPTYVTANGRFVHLESDSYALLSFANGRDELEVWDNACRISMGTRDSLAAAVQGLSDYMGRQPRLPDWTHDGMWLGLQGGSDVVRQKVNTATTAGIPLSGVWVQDWVGKRETAFGRQLFWDWKYDKKTYPDLPELTAELKSQGVRFLGYINPFLAIEGELYKEASARGVCVKDHSGSDYMIVVTTFPAALVDLTNPDAFTWLKGVIQEHMLGVGLSGWMADYGEYLPTDAVLANGEAMHYHNRYPADWARLNYEAMVEAGKLDDTAIFMRAGFSGSSRFTHAIWAGDQMVDWSRHDGLPSVVPAALSSGVVGLGVGHSDLGGFTSLFGKRRSKELLLRWAEHAAFTPIMRSHESNRPDTNWQWDGDAETKAAVAQAARCFVALAPYRRAVLNEYYQTGLPAMRPVGMHYPAVSHGRKVSDYLLGRDLFVAPVVKPGATSYAVDLPDDSWVHLWSGMRFGGGSTRIAAPVGRPPVFYRADSAHTALFESMRES